MGVHVLKAEEGRADPILIALAGCSIFVPSPACVRGCAKARPFDIVNLDIKRHRSLKVRLSLRAHAPLPVGKRIANGFLTDS